MWFITAVQDPVVRKEQAARYKLTCIRAMDLRAPTGDDDSETSPLDFDIGERRNIVERWAEYVEPLWEAIMKRER